MATVSDFLNAVASQLGEPYKWGADNPQTGFDCSGLVYWASASVGAPISARTSQAMFSSLPVVTNPGPGDLVFFDTGDGSPPGHVGICTNQGCTTMIDAPNSTSVVRFDSTAGFGSVMGYRAVPGLSGSDPGGISPTDYVGGGSSSVSWWNPLDDASEIVKDILGGVADIPSIFVKVITGGKSIEELFIRSLEITFGGVITAGGVILFAVTIHRKGQDQNLDKSFNQAVSSYRHIQHLQALEEQHRRGEIRRANAIEHAKEVEAQHERGREKRARAEENLRRKMAGLPPLPPEYTGPPRAARERGPLPPDVPSKPRKRTARSEETATRRGARIPVTSRSDKVPSLSSVRKANRETNRVVHDWRDEMRKRVTEGLGKK